MTGGAYFWFVTCGLLGGLFFGIALVVTIRGFGELRQLLERAEQRKEKA
jgi:hypothetical protein